MRMEKKRKFVPEKKVEIVLEVLQEEQTLNEIVATYEVNPVQLGRWKAEFISNAARVFSKETNEVEKDELLKQVGQISYEISWLKKNLANSKPREERQKIVDVNDKKISISRQANLLTINRTVAAYSICRTQVSQCKINLWRRQKMAKMGKPYNEDFKTDIIRLVRVEKQSTNKVAKNFGVNIARPYETGLNQKMQRETQKAIVLLNLKTSLKKKKRRVLTQIKR